MIYVENLTIGEIAFVRTYSDSGCYIERDGVRYAEAVDPADTNRRYVETDERIRDSDTLDEEIEERLEQADVDRAALVYLLTGEES